MAYSMGINLVHYGLLFFELAELANLGGANIQLTELASLRGIYSNIICFSYYVYIFAYT